MTRPIALLFGLLLAASGARAHPTGGHGSTTKILPIEPSTRLVTYRDRVMPSVAADTEDDDLARFTKLGTLEVSGFSLARISVAGRFNSAQPGEPALLELILVPSAGYVKHRRVKEDTLLLSERLVLKLQPRGKDLFDAKAELQLWMPKYEIWARNRAKGNLNTTVYCRLLE